MPAFTFNPTPTVAEMISASCSQALMALTAMRIRNYNLFWSDPITVAAQFGTNASAIFQADQALVAFIAPQLSAAGAPPDLIAKATAGIPISWAVTFNPDGSVTITNAQTSSSSSGTPPT